MMTQMAAQLFAPMQPPVPHIGFLTLQTFAGGTVNRGGGWGGHCYGWGGCGRGRKNWGWPLFAEAMQQGGYVPPMYPPTAPALLVGGSTTTPTRYPPNPVKWYNNWNYCYSCRFDVEDGHTSQTCTCPPARHKNGHQVGCICENVQQYIATGHAPKISGQHKTQLPPAGF